MAKQLLAIADGGTAGSPPVFAFLEPCSVTVDRLMTIVGTILEAFDDSRRSVREIEGKMKGQRGLRLGLVSRAFALFAFGQNSISISCGEIAVRHKGLITCGLSRN